MLNKIRYKISLFVIMLLVLTTALFYLATAKIMDIHITNEVIKRAGALTKSIAASAGYNILTKDFLGLDNMVFKMHESNSDVEFIAIVDNDMNIIAHSNIGEIGKREPAPLWRPATKRDADGTEITETNGYPGSIQIMSPIVSLNKRLGTVILRVNRSVLLDARQMVRKRILVLFSVILVLGIAGSIAISSFLTRPIKELSVGVSELKEGKGEKLLNVYSHDELGKLTESFNEMITTITDQRGKLIKYADDLEESYVSTVKVLAAAIDARDPYTHGHSARVAEYSVKMGKKMGLSKQDLEDLEVACLFHDIGKIKTPDAILRKRHRLDPEEYREMMRHVEYGAAILSKSPALTKYIPPVRHHHERFDGRGYPDGLRGENIPLFAAIITITDTYDAMTSNRPYRNARTEEETLNEMLNCAGKQFHPDLVEIFLKIMEQSESAAPATIGLTI